MRHDPVYRAEPHTSTISVTATSHAGIDRIVVDLVVGDLVVCTQASLPSMIPCRANGQQITFTCTFSRDADTSTTGPGPTPVGPPKTATCPVSRPLDALSLLTYRATATDSMGRSASTDFITYSGGAPPRAPMFEPAVAARGPASRIDGNVLAPRLDVPVPDIPDVDNPFEPPPTLRPTAADVLRPIWLVSDVPPRPTPQDQVTGFVGAGASRIDVAFMPDPDWGSDYRSFSDATGRIAGDVLFQPAPSYGEDYKLWRRQFWYWVGPAGADAERVTLNGQSICRTRFPGLWAQAARGMTDGQAVVHRITFRDCGALGGGWGTVSGRASRPSRIFVHESGHFLHCMGDEYAEEGYDAHPNCSDPPNTFPTQADCEQVAMQYGYPTAWCVQIQYSSWWRITNGDQEIMSDFNPYNPSPQDWRDTNHDAILKRMAACLLGACW